MEENKVVETVETENTQVENTQDSHEQQSEKTFTQKELDNIIRGRVERERESLAKQLGLESYTKESVEGYLNKVKEYETTTTQLNEKIKTYESEVSNKEKQLTAMKFDIKEDQMKRAFKLAEMEMEDNTELTFDKALEKVVTDFSELRNPKSIKIGMETGNKTNVDPNPYVSDKLKAKYPWLKK